MAKTQSESTLLLRTLLRAFFAGLVSIELLGDKAGAIRGEHLKVRLGYFDEEYFQLDIELQACLQVYARKRDLDKLVFDLHEALGDHET